MGNIDYITVKQASELWHTDISTIGKLLRAGRIPGAIQLGGHWMIPKDAPKPGRKNKGEQQGEFFRFPFYANFPEEHFMLPLTKEEKRLRQAQIDFFSCEFDRAEPVFADLIENTQSIFIKISALFFNCILSAIARNGEKYSDIYAHLNLMLVQDFPHKQEMMLFLPWLHFSLAQYLTASEKFQFEPGNVYSPECLPLVTLLSFSKNIDISQNKKFRFVSDPYELLCQQLEQTEYFFEMQEMHLLLFEYHLLADNRAYAQYHLRKSLQTAYEHNFLLPAACFFPYFPKEYNQILAEFPEEFAGKIRSFGWMIHESIGRFMAEEQHSNYYKDLSKDEFLLSFYALVGYTNKQVAELVGKSEKTIATRYNEIYTKLKVSGKKELVTQIKSMMTHS